MKVGSRCKKKHEEYPGKGQSRNSAYPRINEECISQVSEKIEGRVTEKLSQPFSRTKSRILGALFKLDEFLLNPQVRTHSGAVPGTSRNTDVENQEPNGMVPRKILILKWDPQSTKPIIQLTQTQTKLLPSPSQKEWFHCCPFTCYFSNREFWFAF